MKTTYQVKIETPCSEDWSKMTPVEQGRYCASCQKNVVDMTNMSDAEIQDFFMKAEGEVCAQLHSDQQNRDLVVHETTKSKGWRYLWGLLVAGLFSSQEVKAQGKVMLKPATEERTLSNSVSVNGPISWEFTVKDAKTLEVIPKASITIVNEQRYLAADEKGLVSVNLKSSDSLKLKISAIGYSEAEYTVNPSSSNQVFYLERAVKNLEAVVVVANPDSRFLGRLGGAIACYSVTSRNRIKMPNIDSITSYFAKKPLKVYPNPIVPGSSFQLELNIAQLGEAVIEIIDNQGRIVQRKQIVVDKSNSIITVPTNGAWGQGLYWIRITHHQTRKNYTTKLVLQS